jgi:Zn-dependent peptidase ImmA (M78 family)/transcriptional regulator with XRE-family HTH domain
MLNIRIQNARKAAGLSLRELGERVGLTHSAIKKYEDGQAIPGSAVLIRLAQALSVRIEYFFRQESFALEGIEYRKRSALGKKQLDAITYKVLDQIERRIELESLFPQPPIKEFALVEGFPDLIDDMAQIEELAETMRLDWQLGFDPILDLVDTLETNGVRVFMVDTEENSKFDGLAAHVGKMPIIVVCRTWPGDRQRFTLAHELGHLALKDRLSPALDEERACHRFAGAFLLPRASILQELGKHRTKIELKELSLLKDEFGLSMSAILHRARDLGIIGENYYKSQMQWFSRNGWRRREPGRAFPSEKAHVFEQMVFHALAEGYIGESKAAELMDRTLADFRDIRLAGGGDAAAGQ